jgi:hypothetical protein
MVSAWRLVKVTTELTSLAWQVAVIMCVVCAMASVHADVVLSRLFDTVHLGLVVHTVYWYTVTTYGDTQKIDYTVWCENPISQTCSYGYNTQYAGA